MEDRSNIIKEAIEYRDKLEKKVEELAQSVVRLQISLDFADNTIKKKDRENAELKTEIETLKSQLDFEVQKKEVFEAENEQLKDENYQLQKDCQICENFIDFIPCKPIRDMDYDLQKVISQRDNYQQTLQEIDEIISRTDSHHPPSVANMVSIIRHKLYELTKAESEG